MVTMGPHLEIERTRDGQAVLLPQDLDAIAITTEQGTIHIDLAEQVQNMVLMRASPQSRGPDVIRLILSPMSRPLNMVFNPFVPPASAVCRRTRPTPVLGALLTH